MIFLDGQFLVSYFCELKWSSCGSDRNPSNTADVFRCNQLAPFYVQYSHFKN